VAAVIPMRSPWQGTSTTHAGLNLCSFAVKIRTATAIATGKENLVAVMTITANLAQRSNLPSRMMAVVVIVVFSYLGRGEYLAYNLVSEVNGM